jgi:CarD family transcriptional regulator
MHKIGDKVIDKNGKIFEIESQQDKDFGSGPVSYFVLKPCFPYDFNPEYRCFVPSDKADTILRPVMNKSEALALIDSLSTLETYANVNPRERKVYFQTILSKGDRNDICRVIKTLVEYRDERKKDNKPFSDFDQRLLVSLRSLFDDEVSIALKIPVTDVNGFIKDRTGKALF